MSRIQLRKSIFKMIGVVVFTAFLFSCRGITLARFTGYADSSPSDGHPGCCTTFGEKGGADIAYHDLLLGVIPPKNMLDFSSILEFLFVSIGIATVVVVYDDNKSYIRAIRGRYGSFLFLNYFISLFSQGILNARVF